MTQQQKEIAIGEVAEIFGVKIKCVEETDDIFCDVCCFEWSSKQCRSLLCGGNERSDGKYVHFEILIK